jgi:hypothetical protein
LCVECAHMFCAQCIDRSAGRQLCRACAAKAPAQGAAPLQPPAPPQAGSAPTEAQPQLPPAPPTPPATAAPQAPLQPQMPRLPAQTAPGTASIVSLVCGILSLVLCALFGLGLVLGVAAVLLGAVTLRGGGAGRPYAIAGIITGVLGILFSIFVVAGLWAMFGSFRHLQQTMPAGP